ncbi:MAG: hypothetical protein ACYDBW_12025, partial [Sulfuricaulis sp.]
MSKKETTLNRRPLHVAVLLALGALSSPAHAAVSSSNNNFTMLDSGAGLTGGTNDVVFTWDGTLNTDPATAVVNATITSATPFFGHLWSAYNVKIYGPGTYTISTADTAGGPGCPDVPQPNCASGGNYTVAVPVGEIMGHMKFAWNGTEGIDVIDIWTPGSWTTLNGTNPIEKAGGGSYTGPVYSLVSTDWDKNGVAGGGMIDGPFSGFNANFNISAITSTTNNNFTMLDSGAGLTGGTNDVVFTWDGTLNTDPATAVVNATIT